jgi:nucleoside 2-deoxyribosyltransferase
MKNSHKIYLASPLGFSESGRLFYYEKLIPAVTRLGFEVLDPWKLTSTKLIESATSIPYGKKKQETWRKINKIIGSNNAQAIKNCDLILAILDGVDVDSGTAAEVGYGAALGKTVIGYRGDFRLTGDNEGTQVNLQVEYFIKLNGGMIVTSLDELEITLRKYI